MSETTLDRMKQHVAGCLRCRNAVRIGKLCRIGKHLLDANLVYSFPMLGLILKQRRERKEFAAEHRG